MLDYTKIARIKFAVEKLWNVPLFDLVGLCMPAFSNSKEKAACQPFALDSDSKGCF